MPDQQTKQIEMYFSGKGVSLEQFFLDLHNGNIIKGFGKWLLDIIAIFLLLLSISSTKEINTNKKADNFVDDYLARFQL